MTHLCREDPEKCEPCPRCAREGRDDECLSICPHRESEEANVDDFEGEWPAWKVRLWQFGLRLRCLGLFHDFDDVDTVEGYYARSWYCRRCLGPYEYDEEFVLGGVWDRILWRLGYRVYRWWHSWAWRFER